MGRQIGLQSHKTVLYRYIGSFCLQRDQSALAVTQKEGFILLLAYLVNLAYLSHSLNSHDVPYL